MNCLKIETPGHAESGLAVFLSRLEGQCMHYPWQARQWTEFFKSHGENSRLYTVSDSRGPAGLLFFHLNPWEEQAHLIKIGLKPETRGSGAATALLDEAKTWLKENRFKEIFLEVSARNERAVGFYRKSGFIELCVKKQFYSDGADALAMLLTL